MQVIHISKILDLKQFSLGQAKQFLPFHQPTILQNLITIINNFALSHFPKNIILFPDDSLTLSSTSHSSLYTHLKAIFSENTNENSELLKNSLILGCGLINHLRSIDQQCQVQKIHQHTDIQIQASQIFGIINPQRLQHKKQKNVQIKQSKKIIGYKCILEDQKIYFIIGLSSSSRQFYAASCLLLRKWNFCRLKAKQLALDFNIQTINIICQHLFNIGRGFIRDVPCDNNTYRSGVHQFIKKFQTQQLTKQTLCHVYRSHKIQNSSSLPHELILIKYKIRFLNNLQQQPFLQSLLMLVTEWIMQTPLPYSCSYSSSYQITNNTIIILLGSYYQISTQHTFPSPSTLLQGTSQIQSLLISKNNKNIPHEPNAFQTSVALLDKYQGSKSPSRMLTKNVNSTSRIYSRNSLSDISSQQGSNKKNQGKDISKLQNQIYQLLKAINSIKQILTPAEIQEIIRKYVRKLQLIYPNVNLTLHQYEALITLDAINQLISAEELYLIINKQLQENMQIIKFFLPKGKYQRAISVGKFIISDHLDYLYKKTLRQGFISSSHTQIPYYLKKLVNAYVQQPQITPYLQIDQITIPNILQILQSKNYNSHFYHSVMTILTPQLFRQFNSVIKILSPLLFFIIQILLNGSHHQQLVFCFVGEMLFDICYFPNKFNSLTNAVYLEDKYNHVLSLKQKKILQLVKEGGLKGFGFEIKNLLMQTIQKNKQPQQIQQPIYHIIKIQKSIQLQILYKLLASCHYTQTMNRISKYLQKKNSFALTLSPNKLLLCFILTKNKYNNHVLNTIKQTKQQDDAEFSSISDRILNSQSLIFHDIYKLNPNVKIAGIQLKTVIKNSPIDERLNNISQSSVRKKYKKGNGSINEQQAIQIYLNKQLKQSYEYIQLTWSIKQKYLRYPTLSDNQKIHFMNCASTIYHHKKIINQYLQLSAKMTALRDKFKQEVKSKQLFNKQSI